MFTRASLAIFGVVASVLVAPLPAHAGSGTATLLTTQSDSVIVTIDPEIADLGEIVDELGDDASILTELDTVLTSLDARTAQLLDARPGVTVSMDSRVFLAEEQTSAPWNLSRLDQVSLPLDSVYRYPASAGLGVRVYIVDTGITPNTEFGSRLLTGATAITDGRGTHDCNGHGTHVAGSVAATTWGVAKMASLVPVRVFGCTGSTSAATLLSAIDWILLSHPSGTPGIINMSLSGEANDALDNAVERAASQGLVVVSAAGNSGQDACSESPARAGSSVTVAATTITDARPAYSNFGPCVDIFAPGSDISSVAFNGSTTPVLKSGTSMAAPHVSGVAALIWGAAPSLSASTVESRLLSQAVSGVVSGAGAGSPNLLASVTTINADLLPGAVTGVRSTAQTATTLSLAWTAASALSAPVTDYSILYRRDGQAAWTTAADGVSTSTNAVISGLVPGARYEVRIRARTAHGVGPLSDPLSVATRSATPGPPRSVRTNWTVATGASVAWDTPTYTGLSAITDYRLQVRLRGSTSWQTIADGVSTTRSHRIANLRPNSPYEFRVAAVNQHGAGSYSAVLSFQTKTLTPSSPTSLRVSRASATQPTIAWTAPSWAGATAIADYTIQYRRAGTSTWTTLNDGISTTTSARIAGLRANTNYEVRVRARNSHGASPYSSTFAFRTQTLTPSAPTGLRVSTASATQPVIGWAAPSWPGATAITDYTIQYRRTGTSTWITLNDGISTTRSARIPNLLPTTSYEVRVRARNSHGTGPYSTTLRVTTLAP